jgi:hypothetical protein
LGIHGIFGQTWLTMCWDGAVWAAFFAPERGMRLRSPKSIIIFFNVLAKNAKPGTPIASLEKYG